jgi:hypothetical protein
LTYKEQEIERSLASLEEKEKNMVMKMANIDKREKAVSERETKPVQHESNN